MSKFLSLKSDQLNISWRISVPKSMCTIKSMSKKLGLLYEKIHECENNRMLFYGS